VINGDTTISRSFIIDVEEESGQPSWVLWVLGIGIMILVVVIIGLFMWSGPRLEQYGIEE